MFICREKGCVYLIKRSCTHSNIALSEVVLHSCVISLLIMENIVVFDLVYCLSAIKKLGTRFDLMSMEDCRH